MNKVVAFYKVSSVFVFEIASSADLRDCPESYPYSYLHQPSEQERVVVNIIKGPLGFGFSLGKMYSDKHSYLI